MMPPTSGNRESASSSEEWETTLQKQSEKILVEVGELEACLSCPSDVEGIIDHFSKKAWDHEGRRRFVFIKTKEGNLVADVRQHAILRQRQDTDYGSSQRSSST